MSDSASGDPQDDMSDSFQTSACRINKLKTIAPRHRQLLVPRLARTKHRLEGTRLGWILMGAVCSGLTRGPRGGHFCLPRDFDLEPSASPEKKAHPALALVLSRPRHGIHAMGQRGMTTHRIHIQISQSTLASHGAEFIDQAAGLRKHSAILVLEPLHTGLLD